MSAGRCRFCKAPIEWAKSATTGKAILLDVEPRADGNLFLSDGVVRHAAELPQWKLQMTPLRVSHFATCKDAASWRRK